jgi:hypothetical protein
VNNNIKRNKTMGIYDGAYKVVELAMNLREESLSEAKK